MLTLMLLLVREYIYSYSQIIDRYSYIECAFVRYVQVGVPLLYNTLIDSRSATVFAFHMPHIVHEYTQPTLCRMKRHSIIRAPHGSVVSTRYWPEPIQALGLQ